MKYYFQVAKHLFCVHLPDGDNLMSEMGQYTPFIVDEGGDVLFIVRVVTAADFPSTEGLKEEMNQDDDGSQIMAGHVGERPYFEFLLWGKRAARMLTDSNYHEAVIVLEEDRLFGINNALMVMFALATAVHQTALFHSSVVVWQRKAYMFLGKSGTGKSTHSRLWLQYIKGTALLNDDNPVVRIIDGQAIVFGSPWSGKTPCYINRHFPLGGIVRLRQAPHNAIRPLRGIEAYAALIPSISGKRWDKQVAEGLHETENLLAGQRVWHLDCLPDEAAAQLCCQTITRE
jgi:hypothetical protein